MAHPDGVRETSPISDDDELRAAWTAVVGAEADALGALDELLGRHREPHRRYHTVRHVSWVVRHVQELAPTEPVADLGAVTMAAFFHDAVYEAGAVDNERQSAALAERVLDQLGWPHERTRRVGELIAATEQHEPSDDADAAVLVDADLAVLGAEPAAYQAYATAVRGEYGHLDDTVWTAGRSAVLRRLLDRPTLYATATGRARWESRARANLTAELASLR